jgi:hypothetical protein
VAVEKVLLGGGTRRAGKIDIELSLGDVSIPVSPSAANILSTGQRNALALATYFPRATQPGSPFGFLILDDPVHSFDRWRVRYLARILNELAETRQVVVFTHDERLWHEVRALGGHAEHIRLDRPRGGQSFVRAVDITSPGLQHLGDLERILRAEDVAAIGTEAAVTGLTLAMCRQALDAEVWAQVEVLRRRSGSADDEIAAEREQTIDTRQQLRILNQALSEVGCGELALGSYERTISALNAGAHGRAVPASKHKRRQWVKDTRTLIQMVRGAGR